MKRRPNLPMRWPSAPLQVRWHSPRSNNPGSPLPSAKSPSPSNSMDGDIPHNISETKVLRIMANSYKYAIDRKVSIDTLAPCSRSDIYGRAHTGSLAERYENDYRFENASVRRSHPEPRRRRDRRNHPYRGARLR